MQTDMHGAARDYGSIHNLVAAKGRNRGEASASRSRTVRAIGAPDRRGVGFARYVMARMTSRGDLAGAVEVAKSRWPGDAKVIDSLKAAVGAGTTTGEDWASALVPAHQTLASEFVEFLRPQTILGQFGRNGIPAVRRVPFNVSIPRQTSAGQGYWVGEGKAKPLTAWTYDRINLDFAKVANIAVITDELARSSAPDAEILVRDELARALIERLDIDFVDPLKAAVARVSPASITNGVAPIASTGTDADAVRADIKAAIASFVSSNNTPRSAVWIMPSLTALSLSLMTNPLGAAEFEDINLAGGFLAGLPVIVSDYVPAGTVILVNASDIFLADDGAVGVDVSREASLEMNDAPTSDSTTPTGTSLVSLWQTNSIGVRAERYINWEKRHPGSVAVLSDVAWGGDIALS